MTKEDILQEVSQISSDQSVQGALLEAIEDRWEELEPDFRAALECVEKGNAGEKDTMIAFIGVVYAAQFRDNAMFAPLVHIAHRDIEFLDNFLGLAYTDLLDTFLYCTADSVEDRRLLVDLIRDTQADQYARDSGLMALAQCWKDGKYPEEEWKNLLKDLSRETASHAQVFFLTDVIGTIARCHYTDMKDIIRKCAEDGSIDFSVHGDYAELVDTLYGENDEPFVDTSFDAVLTLAGWYNADGLDPARSQKALEKNMETAQREMECKKAKDAVLSIKPVRVGRNDPCPCGSGKKYKNCCLRRDEEARKRLNDIEPYETKMQYLRNYPVTSFNPATGQKIPHFTRKKEHSAPYLEDFYDEETIMTDALIYLALYHLPTGLFGENIDRAGRRKAYLLEAWDRFRKQYEREGYSSLKDYDRDHMIHYESEEWIVKLLDLLQRTGDTEKAHEVEQFLKEKTEGLTGRSFTRRKVTPLWRDSDDDD